MRALVPKPMKGLFKSKPKVRTPADTVRRLRELLIYFNGSSNIDQDPKWLEKMEELEKLIEALKIILYGSTESEPVPEACAQVTQEFFRENTLRLLILCLPNVNLEMVSLRLEKMLPKWSQICKDNRFNRVSLLVITWKQTSISWTFWSKGMKTTKLPCIMGEC